MLTRSCCIKGSANPGTGALIKRGEDAQGYAWKDGHVTTERLERCSYKPRNARQHRERGRGEEGVFPNAFRGPGLPHLGFGVSPQHGERVHVCRFSPQCVVFVTAASETNTVRGGGGAVLSSYGEDSVGLRPWARPSETFLVLSFSSLGWSCLVLPPGQIRLWVTHRASLAGLC